jgi:hypothetical protein
MDEFRTSISVPAPKTGQFVSFVLQRRPDLSSRARITARTLAMA